jgi:hypothetical protein
MATAIPGEIFSSSFTDSVNNATSTTTIYTVPAGRYAFVNWITFQLNTNSPFDEEFIFSIGPNIVARFGSSSNANPGFDYLGSQGLISGKDYFTHQPYIIPAGQTVSLTKNGGFTILDMSASILVREFLLTA